MTRRRRSRALRLEERRKAAIVRADGLIERHQDEIALLAAAKHRLLRGDDGELETLERIVLEGDWRQR